MSIEVRAITPSLGLEITGVDLSRDLSAAEEKTIRDAWIQSGVVLIRNAVKNDEEHMRLSKLFGQMEPAATKHLNAEDNPYMMMLKYDPSVPRDRTPQEYVVNGDVRAGWLGWHWDQSFMPTIVRGAVLRMVEPAAQNGETGFIDGVAAYDRLSPDMQARIDTLEVVYEFNPDFCSGQFGFPRDIAYYEGQKDQSFLANYKFPPVVHPMVITQTETGRKVLKLSPMHARYILGMDKTESDALLTELADHLVEDRYAYYHKWGKDDVIIWDNWRVIHGARGVPLDVPRLGKRTTIMGDYAVGRYLDENLDRNREVKRIID